MGSERPRPPGQLAVPTPVATGLGFLSAAWMSGGTLAETCKGRTDCRLHTEACCCHLEGDPECVSPSRTAGAGPGLGPGGGGLNREWAARLVRRPQGGPENGYSIQSLPGTEQTQTLR